MPASIRTAGTSAGRHAKRAGAEPVEDRAPDGQQRSAGDPAGSGGAIARVNPGTDASDRNDATVHTTGAAANTANTADAFDRTFHAAVTEAGLRLEALGRHVPIFRRVVGAGQAVLLVARCGRLDQPNHKDHLMVITRDRVVITSESRSLRRARVHLNAAVAALLNVRWQADTASVEFAATAIDGVRERFLIEAPTPAVVSHVDAVLGYVFRPAGTRRFNPVEPIMPSWMNPAGAY
ncbi:MAG TPA: hypothetical protein VH442_05160 [Micromonosporaceae bacterium]